MGGVEIWLALILLFDFSPIVPHPVHSDYFRISLPNLGTRGRVALKLFSASNICVHHVTKQLKKCPIGKGKEGVERKEGV
jgi:hypothetical protein